MGHDPLPVPHYEILTGEHAGNLVTQIGTWEFEAQG